MGLESPRELKPILDKTKVFSLFSGGKDSITLAHLLSKYNHLDSIVFLDTGIGLEDNRIHVEKIAKKNDWNLIVYRTPAVYEDLVLEYGFPHYKNHNIFMNYLKGRGIQLFHREFPHGVLASGVRQKESKRRIVNTKVIGKWERTTVIAPMFNASSMQVWNYVRKNELELSPSYQTLHISGDCLCGSFASPYELLQIRTFYPELFERLCKLEKRACHKRCNTWGGNVKGGTEDAKKQTTLIGCFECSQN